MTEDKSKNGRERSLLKKVKPRIVRQVRRLHTLVELSEADNLLCATPAVMTMLHTWGANLSYHPHAHRIVTGGGLTADGQSWKVGRGKADYLFPIPVLVKKFRGKFLAELKKLLAKGKLRFSPAQQYLNNPRCFAAWLRPFYQRCRYYGVWSNRDRAERLEHCRFLISGQAKTLVPEDDSSLETSEQSTDSEQPEVVNCSACDGRPMQLLAFAKPATRAALYSGRFPCWPFFPVHPRGP